MSLEEMPQMKRPNPVVIRLFTEIHSTAASVVSHIMTYPFDLYTSAPLPKNKKKVSEHVMNVVIGSYIPVQFVNFVRKRSNLRNRRYLV